MTLIFHDFVAFPAALAGNARSPADIAHGEIGFARILQLLTALHSNLL